MPDRTCSVDGCVKPTRAGAGATLCPMHYHRWYRHGSFDKVATSRNAPRVAKPRRYKQSYRPDHPLAMKNGHVWEHRMVLFDVIGWGPHPCHWCSAPLKWGGKGTGSIYVDHLDGDGANNDPSNLVPSCNGCNAGRGMQERSDALREAGWWSNHDTIERLTTPSRRSRIDA